MVEEKTKQRASASLIFGAINEYVKAVQSGPYARRTRVALLWSAVSLFYVAGDLEVAGSSAATLVGVSIKNIDHEKFCFFLLCVTTYYTALFVFAFAKIWSVGRPVRLFCKIFRHRKKRVGKSDFVQTEREINRAEENMSLWNSLPYIDHELVREKDVSVVDDMSKEDEVFNFMLRQPFFGLLENLLARMFFPLAVCIVALVVLVCEIWC
ncbi:MAG: hypothetical protein MPK34_00130 [Gammaproteobacteria bacterium]|nr:hypothetical protein [Gammaproteobacteria bacterium]MDA7962408.1 hypothetical protein [Gammaproteobacteria bacterium]